MRYALILGLVVASFHSSKAQETPNRQTVIQALHRAVEFFRQHASAGGGYVFQVSADLTKREGEGRVDDTTAWIEPPATPAVGMAYLEAYRWCEEPILLAAAKETANALVQGQLRSGGWGERIDFDPEKRLWHSYRVEPKSEKQGRNTTTFDDDKTQSAIRLLVQVDQQLNFKDETFHEAAIFALDAVLRAQYSCGAWPQKYNGQLFEPDPQSRRASFPADWPREFPNESYGNFYTLNDDTLSDLITTLLDAWEVYNDKRYLKSAQRGGDFLLLAQLPEPQPGWAQQYNRTMQPAWARRFEPPAITGGESQNVMRTLIALYRRTARVDSKAGRFLEPLPRAIEYYRTLLLPDGRIPRFTEIATDRPLYFTRDYRLTHDDSDMPTHYGFIVGASFDSIERELNSARKLPKDQRRDSTTSKLRDTHPNDEQVAKIMGDLDDRGAWVEPGRLKFYGKDDSTREVIRSATFIKNIRVLASWLGADADR